MDREDAEASIRRVFAEERRAAHRDHLDAMHRAARAVRLTGAFLREDDAADFLGISERTLADLRRSGVPFHTRRLHRKHWYRRTGPVEQGRGSLESYVSGEIGPSSED